MKLQLSSFQPLVIEQVSPVVDGGRYPIKRLAGEKVEVEEKWVPFFKTGKELRERLNS